MGLRITSNILSLGVQRNLSTTTRALARSLQRLASGSRINTGRDDPAGLAMASGLEAQRRGLIQAVRNLNDSRGFLETADGAMAEQVNMVQRMRELAVQAANGTLNDATRKYLDNECQALLAEFTRLTTQTQFNGINLLDGSFKTTSIQVGAKKGEAININLSSMQTANVFQQSVSAGYGDGTFKSPQTISCPTDPTSSTTADMNGDGKLDILTVSADFSGNDCVYLYLGNGNGTFAAASTYPLFIPGVGSQFVAAADLNGDGFQDAIFNDATSFVSVMLGNGNGTFQSRNDIYMGTGFSYWGTNVDLNGDGKIDLVFTNNNFPGLVVVGLGNGNGTFAARTTYATGTTPRGVLTTDFNGDGKLDLFIADTGSNTGSILLGNGNGTFIARTTVASTGAPESVSAGDVNGDGKLDVTMGSNTTVIDLYLGNGNGTFLARRTIASGDYPYAILRDLNGDGRLDIVSNSGNGFGVQIGNGDGTFGTLSRLSTVSGFTLPTSADVNGDGAIDLVNSDFSSDLIQVYLGNAVYTSVAATVSISTQSAAQDMLQVFSDALAYVNSARASIGALQSRLDFATSVNMNTIENISAARSQIMDTDMAAETAEFARLQILQRAGIAVLGQANLNSNLSLKLLEAL